MQDESFNKKICGAVNGELGECKMQGCASRVTALALPDGLAWPCLLHKNAGNNLLPLSVPWRRALPPWSADDFLGFPSLDQECLSYQKERCGSTDCYIKPKRDLHVPLDQRNLCIFCIVWNPFCFFSADLVWGNGCREPRPLPVSSSSEMFLSGTNVAVLTPRITPKYTFVYSIFSISMVLKSVGNFMLI